jgi:hypothetical protein
MIESFLAALSVFVLLNVLGLLIKSNFDISLIFSIIVLIINLYLRGLV